MTLKEVINEVVASALAQPDIRMVVRNDIYRLNGCPSTRYGVFAYTQGMHQEGANDDYREYAFTLFYVDRLTEDQSNEEEIQSAGIEALDSILDRLCEVDGMDVSSRTFQPFTEKFTDYCAGVYAEVRIIASKSAICAHHFADYNEDYNKDYLIY